MRGELYRLRWDTEIHPIKRVGCHGCCFILYFHGHKGLGPSGGTFILAGPPTKVEVDLHWPPTCETIGSFRFCPTRYPVPDFRIAALAFWTKSIPAPWPRTGWLNFGDFHFPTLPSAPKLSLRGYLSAGPMPCESSAATSCRERNNLIRVRDFRALQPPHGRRSGFEATSDHS